MGKVFAWIGEDLAKRLKFVDDTVELSETDIKRIIKDLRDEISLMDECLEEDVISFRHHAQRVRNSYKQVADEEIRATQDMWESLHTLRCETQKRIEQSRELTQSIKGDIKEIKTALDTINVYGLDRLLDLIYKVKNMSDKERDMLSQLLSLKV